MHPGTDAQPGIVGRARHRQVLERAVSAGLDGGPALTVVVGDPGIGKTTLVDAVAGGYAGTAVTVLRGFASAETSAAFDMWAGVRRGLGATASMGGGDVEEARWEQVELLAEGIAAAAPALVVLEDAHWADQQSLWLLQRLPHVLAGVRVAVVVTSRDESLGAVRPNNVVALGGLDHAEVAELLGSFGREVPDDEVSRIVELTGGNPLFLREVAVHGADGRLPAAVEDALDWALNGLPDDVMDLLLALALGGAAMAPPTLQLATGAGHDELEAGIDTAVRAGVLEPGPQDRPVFRHALLAEAVRAKAGAARRRAMHRSLAVAWSGADGSAWSDAEAARHELGAVPDVEAAEAATSASDAARGLVDDGDPGAAAELLRIAARTVETHAAEATLLGARLLVELGEALDQSGVADAATEAYEAAAVAARRSGDARLVARAVVGAAGHLNPLEPAPSMVRRLVEAERGLGPGDDPLRVALLGRLAWASTAGFDVAASVRYGDEAVEIARRLGAPDLLATALVDRHFAPVDVEGVRAHAAAADEIAALGEDHRMTRVVLQGLEWQFDARLDSGDVDGAAAVVDRFDAAAALMMSPRARHKSCVMTGILALVRGDRVGALGLFDSALELGRGAVNERELVSVHLAGRSMATWIWGVPDPVWARERDRVVGYSGPAAAPFFAARIAMTELLLGNRDAARGLVAPLLGRPETVVRAYQGIPTLLLVGDLVCDLALAGDHVAVIARMLAPLTGHLGSGANSLNLGVDATLGRLALLDGDPRSAVEHLQAAVAFTSSMPSPPLEARSRAYLADAREAAGAGGAAASERAAAERIAERIGMDLHPEHARRSERPARSAPPGRARLARSGSGWDVQWREGGVSVPSMAGMDHLATLLARPDVEVAATDLAGMGRPQADLGPVLDAQAKREYRRRVAELESEIDEAQQYADPYREDRARQELAAVMDELRRAVGLGGRDRPTGSGAERARVNVTRNLRRAIATIGEALPDLGAHLDVSVRTGSYCTYTPDPTAAIDWVVEP